MIKRFFTNFDLFGSWPTLRVRGEPEALNFCGGLFSFILLVTFFSIFLSKAYRISTYLEIDAKATINVSMG